MLSLVHCYFLSLRGPPKAMRYFLISIILFLAVMQIVLAWRIFAGLKSIYPKLRFWKLLLPLLFLCAVTFYGFMPGGSAPRALQVFSHYYLAVTAYAIMLLLVKDLLIFVLRLIRREKIKPRLMLYSTLITMALSLLIVAYGSLHAQNIITRTYDISLAKPSLQRPVKVAMFSDLHLGVEYGAAKVESIVTKINAASPDVVFIVGDFFNDDYAALDDPAAIEAALKRIDAELGVYLVWGNHDSGASFAEMRGLIERSQIVLLEDESLKVNELFTLVGRRDSRPILYEGTARQAMEWQQVDDTLPLIVLDHQPGNYKEYLGTAADLILSGHTHKGQLFPGNILTSLVYDYDYGLHQIPGTGQQMVISSGIGTWGPPIRVLSDAELLIINLK